MLCDFLKAKRISLFLLFAVLLNGFLIIIGCDADYGLKRICDLIVGDAFYAR